MKQTALAVTFCVVRRTLTLALSAVFVFTGAGHAGGDSGTPPGFEIVLDGYDLAHTLANGSLRILFVGGGMSTGWLLPAIGGRIDCETAGVFGIGDGRADDGVNGAYSRLDGLLDDRWDVIVLGTSIESVPERYGTGIMDHVAAGTGLVYLGNPGDIRSYVTGGDVGDRAFGRMYPGSCTPRIAGRHHDGIMTTLSLPSGVSSRREIDSVLACLCHTLLFTAGHQGDVVFNRQQRSDDPLEQESMGMMIYRVDLYNYGDERPMTITRIYRNDQGIFHRQQDRFIIAEGRSFIQFEYPEMTAGTYAMDITVGDSTGVSDISGYPFTVTAVEEMESISAWYPVFPRNDYLMGTIRMDGEMKPGVEMTAAVIDSWGRLYEQSPFRFRPQGRSVDYILASPPTPATTVTLEARFYRNNILSGIRRELMPLEPEGGDAFHIFADGPGAQAPPERILFAALKRAGVTGVVIGDDGSPDETYAVGRAAYAENLLVMADNLVDMDDPASAPASSDTIAHFSPFEHPPAVVPFDGAADVSVPSLVLCPSIGGIGGDMENILRYIPWKALFVGANGLYLRGGNGYPRVVTPTLEPAGEFNMLAGEGARIRNGVDRLVVPLTPEINPASVTLNGGAGGGIDRYLFEDGDIRYIGLLDAELPAGEMAGRTLDLVYGDDAVYSVYNVLTGEFVGAASRFQVEYVPGKPALYAFLPYRLQTIRLATDMTLAAPGETITVTAELVTRDPGADVGRHVVEMTVYGPDGEKAPWFSRLCATESGSILETITPAPEDPPGRWEIRVRDCATGRTASRYFTLRPASSGIYGTE